MHALDQLNLQIHYRRRTSRVTIRIKPDSCVHVTAPYGVSEVEVKKFLQTKSKWIHEKLRIFETLPKTRRLNFISGEVLPLLGENLILKIVDGVSSVTLLEEDKILLVSVPQNEEKKENFIRTKVIKWFQDMAFEKIKERTEHYCSILGILPQSLSLKNYKSRWGACSSKGDLIFNWQIITFSPKHFDYVVAHEICHLKEMNHGPRFYKLLSHLGFHKSEIHKQMRYLRNVF